MVLSHFPPCFPWFNQSLTPQKKTCFSDIALDVQRSITAKVNLLKSEQKSAEFEQVSSMAQAQGAHRLFQYKNYGKIIW